MRPSARTLRTLAIVLVLTSTSVALAAPGGVPGKPGGDPGEETAVNNLSFPVLFSAAAVPMPSSLEPGTSILEGYYLLWDGVNPPCDPSSPLCTLDPNDPTLDRVYVQKDIDNDWQAGFLEDEGTIVVDYIDVADNLESVPWRTTSVVRIEFVPFQDTLLREFALPGYEMAYVGGQGIGEVWGVVAPNEESPTAYLLQEGDLAFGYATLYSRCMLLSLTKLSAGAGSLDVEPDPDGANYKWDRDALVWIPDVDRVGDEEVAQTIVVDPFSAEINVKGRLIYGHNWKLKETQMEPEVSKAGWWRLTFFNVCGTPSPLNFTDLTQTFDPTASAAEAEAEEEPGEGTYPRSPVVRDDLDLVYIDIYIQTSSSGGKGGQGGGGKGGGNSGGGKGRR